jgi:hypothetical protein
MAKQNDTETKNYSKTFWIVAIFSLALLVRILHLWDLQSAPFFGCLIGDGEGYHAWACVIVAGDWMGKDVFYQAPLYPYFLAVIYRLLGTDPTWVLKIQAVMGAISCVLILDATWRLFSKRTGILAGLMLTLYGPSLFYEILIQKSALDLFFGSLIVWLLCGLVEQRRQRTLVALGTSLGALVLTRENALIFILPILCWLLFDGLDLWRLLRRSGKRVEKADAVPPPDDVHSSTPGPGLRLMNIAFFLLGLSFVLLPVAVRNRHVGGEFHLTTSQLGPNLYIGNNPDASGFYEPLRFARGHSLYERSDATQIAEEATGRKMTPAEVSKYYTDQVMTFIRTQPRAWLQLMGRKFLLVWNAPEVMDYEDMYTYAEWSRVLQGCRLFHFGGLLPLGVIGFISTWHQRNRLWFLYAMIASFLIALMIFYIFGRYRYPLVPFLIPLAAVGVDRILRFVRSPEPKTMLHYALVAGVVIAICHIPMVSTANMKSNTASNLANALTEKKRYTEAFDFHRRAVRWNPNNPIAHNNFGQLLRQQGKHDDAGQHFQRALKLKPDYAAARRNLRSLQSNLHGAKQNETRKTNDEVE